MGEDLGHDAQALGRLTSVDGGPPGRLTPTEDLRAVAAEAPESTPEPLTLAEAKGGVDRPGGSGGERARARGRSTLVRDEAARAELALAEGDDPAANEHAAVPLSFLDTLSITRPAWLEDVGRGTAAHREAKARRLEREAMRRTREANVDGFYEHNAKAKGRWHRARAGGQRARIETVTRCCEDTVIIACQACGVVREKPGRCRVGLLCTSCRGKIASEKRAQFLRARKVVRTEAAAAGLFRQVRRGGRYSEKLLTLTMPHDPRHGVGERIDLARRAWRFFLKRLNAWLRSIGAHDKTHWFRTLEWTPGDDGRGHPHFHVWLLSPFLPREELVSWWHASLSAAGHCLSQPPIVDVREVTDGIGAAAEVIKYLTKDVVGGKLVAADVFAEVYKALDGTRVTQASRGFMARARREPARCECGATGCLVKVVPGAEGQAHPRDKTRDRPCHAEGAPGPLSSTVQGTTVDTTWGTRGAKNAGTVVKASRPEASRHRAGVHLGPQPGPAARRDLER